ncbi:MAG: HupE/UreJ family protein [Bauldia sp.]|nr:HupE/UreJ family protein [Bauldia sp.]
MKLTIRVVLPATFALAATPAFAHVGIGETTGFSAGFAHPLSGLDHMAVMIAVGLWAALKGGRALWVWPAAFVGVMIVGGLLGMLGVPIPFVEPAILASVVALGLLVALAVDLPFAAGAAIIGFFALFHGHAHGMEVPQAANGLAYMGGFAAATAVLHAVGIGSAAVVGTRFRGMVRGAGAACAAIGIALFVGAL